MDFSTFLHPISVPKAIERIGNRHAHTSPHEHGSRVRKFSMAAVFIRMFQHSQELAIVVIVFRKQQEEHSRKQHELCSCRDNTASVPLRVLVRGQNGEAGLSLEAAQWARLTVVETAQ